MAVFVFTIPIGPDNYDRLYHTLASFAAQNVQVRLAICHAGERSMIQNILRPFQHLISYERHAPDKGQSHAINEGWRALDGDFYGWLNADDTLAPGALERVVELFIENPKVDIVCGQSLIFDETDAFIGLHPAVKAPDEDLFRSNIISQPSCFVSRKALLEVDYLSEDLDYCMDWDLWVRLMESGFKFTYTPEILSAVLWDRDTKTGTFGPRRRKEIRDVVARKKEPLTTAKTMFGFWVHHLAEYTIFSKIVKMLLGLARHGKRQTTSFWGSGAQEGVVRLFHYGDLPRSKLRLNYYNPDNVRVINFQDEEISNTSEIVTVLDQEILPEKNYSLKVSSDHKIATELKSIELI